MLLLSSSLRRLRTTWSAPPVLLVLLAGVLVPGCTIHSSYEASRFGPSGVHIAAETVDDRSLEGEVLALMSDTLVVRLLKRSGASTPTLVRLPANRLRTAQFEGASSLDLSASFWTPTRRWREGVRLRSRYPQGLSPEVRSKLLRTYDQSTMPTIQ
jgi:hypothetical protein